MVKYCSQLQGSLDVCILLSQIEKQSTHHLGTYHGIMDNFGVSSGVKYHR